MTEKFISEILIKAIEKMAKQDLTKNDESWKKEASVLLDERIAAFNRLEWLSSQQQPRFN